MARKSRGRTTKKNKNAAAAAAEAEAEANAEPHSFVVHRGKVGKSVQELTKDFRRVMEPNTASSIKVRPKNVIKDFVHVAGLLRVSHLCSFTKTDLGPYLKLARFPRGPTLTFKVSEYALARDVRSSLKRQITYDKQFLHHALLIMNGFGGSEEAGGREIQLMASMFQNMFPSLNVPKVKLNAIRRCVLLDYDKDSRSVEFRHYTVKVVPVGMSRGVKKIVQGKVPNLSRLEDVSQFLGRGGADANLSESEFEDDDASKVTLPDAQRVGSRGNLASAQSSVRLVELGPRMRLELVKIEEGLHEGDVLYHRHVEKTEEEKAKIRATREKRKREKEQRRKEQEKNVKAKQEKRDAHKKKSLEGMNKGKDGPKNLPEGFKARADSDSAESEADDDAQWYQEEVGEKPDKDLFDRPEHRSGDKRKHSSGAGGDPRMMKRFKRGGSADRGGRGTDRGRSGGRGGGRAERGRGGGRGGGFGGGRGRGGGDRGGRGGGFGGGRGRGGGDRGGRGGGGRGGGSDRKSSGKRERKVFNSQGVGPSFNKNKVNKGPRVVSKKGRR